MTDALDIIVITLGVFFLMWAAWFVTLAGAPRAPQREE